MGSADAWAKANVNAPPTTAPAPASEPAADVIELAEAVGLSFEGAYAAREQAATGLEEFEGGDVIIIGSTTLIIVLLVILILVLL
jgi:hypothetical protein